jgi:(p)ppGpp synthase/HD superfamily hydrolase
MATLFSIKRSKNMSLLCAAAVLHDTVEDCGVTLEKIAKKFGHQVSALVGELTLNKEEYEKIGKKEYLLQEMLKMSNYALCIKLCDRLDNIRDMATMGQSFRERYTAETLFILKGVKNNRMLTRTQKQIVKLLEAELKIKNNAESANKD